MDAVNESSTVIDDGLSIISSSTTQSPSPDDERSGALLWHISDHTTENGIDNRTPLPVQIIVSSPTKGKFANSEKGRSPRQAISLTCCRC